MTSETWRPTTILRTIYPVTSSSEPVRVLTDQGDGYLKGLGNRVGPHALACDLIGTELARIVGLKTFAYSVIAVTPDDEIWFASGRKMLPGPAFITRAEPGESWDGTEETLRSIDNANDVNRLVVLDTWIRNCDRYPPDITVRGPNLDNVFISRMGAPRGKLVLRAIDHGHCLTAGDALSPKIGHIDVIKDERIYGMFPQFQPFLDETTMASALDVLRSVTPDLIQRIVDLVPLEWEVDRPTREALVGVLIDRARFVANDLLTRIWPQRRLNLQ